MSCVLGQSCLDCATQGCCCTLLYVYVFHFFRKHKQLVWSSWTKLFNHFHFGSFGSSRAAEWFQFLYLGDRDSVVPPSSMFWWIVTFTVQNFSPV